MERRRVVVTGMGGVTPGGLNAPESWDAVRAGATMVRVGTDIFGSRHYT